jgi:phospholipid transport system substrate-binding protein
MPKAQPPRLTTLALAFAIGASGAGLALSPVSALPAFAQTSDPAAGVIDGFDRTLLAAMKQSKTLGLQGRFSKMEPAVRTTFDLPAMMRVASGAYWSKMSAADQSALVAAFGRFSAATYAHNFDDFSGQKFLITGVDTRLPDKLVRSQLVIGGSAPINLVYRMRQDDGRWRIIDVFYNGTISQLAQQASDFSATLATGGAAALIKKLDNQTDRLLHNG